MTVTSSVLALDVGSRRIGLAVASLQARLPRPLTTLEWNDEFFAKLQELVQREEIGQLVVGRPRNMQGEVTAQTAEIERFTDKLQQQLALPVDFQDESLTSKQAEAELQQRGGTYTKGDIDALAATYILQDWLNEREADK